jgi:hypothetical protein
MFHGAGWLCLRDGLSLFLILFRCLGRGWVAGVTPVVPVPRAGRPSWVVGAGLRGQPGLSRARMALRASASCLAQGQSSGIFRVRRRWPRTSLAAVCSRV